MSEGVEVNRNGGSSEADDSSTIPSFEWVDKEIRTRQKINEV